MAKAARVRGGRGARTRSAEREPSERRGVRAFWSGTLSFGLVSVPVDLHTAVRSAAPALRMLAPDGTPLARRYRCPEHDRDLDDDEIVRGYEVEPGEHVVVTDEELEALAPRASRDIDLRRFVPRAQLDPFRFERAYVLAPRGETVKAYRLLAEVMEAEDRAGIATFVLRGKEHLVAILASGGVLHAETLRFAGEVRTAETVGLPARAKPDAEKVRAFAKAIRAGSVDALPRDELEDRHALRLAELAERKRARGEDLVEARAGEAGEAGEDGLEEDAEGTGDLLETLKRSLAGGRAARERRLAPRRAGRGGRGPGRLERLSKRELLERARRADLRGRSSMTKAALVRALARA